MEAPYTIATFPAPLDTENGKTYASPVYGLGGSRKRKRHEVAVGIDGEGVNIYNIQTQNLTTFYALPPQTYLCCPPCATYYKGVKGVGAQGRTYVVLRDGPKDAKRRLVCLTQDVHAAKQLDVRPEAPAKQAIKLQSGDVVSLDVVGTSAGGPGTASSEVIVTYKNGSVDCVAGDLSTKLWEHVAASSDKAGGEVEHVEYAGVVDLDSARKGLLASREDITAQLDSAATSLTRLSAPSLLVQVVRKGTTRQVRLYSLRPTENDLILGPKPGIQHLMVYDLPAPKKSRSAQRAIFDLNAASGKLCQLVDGQLLIYDLSGTLPSLATVLGSKTEPITSFARISASSVLAAHADKAVLYETKYGSIQGSLNLPSWQSTEVPGQRRTVSEEDRSASPWHAVSSFSSLGVVVGTAGTSLVALELSGALKSTKRVRSASTLLVDVLGKAVITTGPKVTPNAEKSENASKKWDVWKTDVDSAIDGSDASNVERLIARALRMKSALGQEPQPQDNASDSSRLNDEADQGPQGLTAASFDIAHIDRRKVLYVLSKCFRAGSDEEVSGANGLVTTFGSAVVYKWLALTGFLTVPYLQQAMQLKEEHSGVTPAVLPGDIMASIRWFDEFHLLHDMLALPVYWEVVEIVQALRLLIQSFDTPAEDDTLRKALPAPPGKADGDTTMTNGGTADSQLEMELLATQKDLDHAVSALSTGLEMRSDTIRLSLKRLHAFPSKTVTKCMRTMMTHEEIVFFMKILRIELLEGGWTSRYTDMIDVDEDVQANGVDGVGQVPGGVSDQAIGTISDLMICAIDAIGLSGWLVGQGGDAYETTDLIDGLKSEVAACLEGLFEDDTVATFLDELQRYDYSLTQVHGRKRKRKVVERDVELEEAVLPVGCRAEPVVVKGRGTKDMTKSKALLAIERRGRVGKYEIDRIRI